MHEISLVKHFFVELRPFLSQHDNAPVHKAKTIKKWFIESSVKLKDELERQLWARPQRPTSCRTSVEQISTAMIYWSSFQKSRSR